MTTKMKLCFSAFILVGATVLLFSGCKKEDEKNAPLLYTTAVTNITATTATSGGNITADGGAPVTACGVVWSTSQNPIIESNQGITSDGSGTDTWVSELVGLQSNITYYVRAYATNIAGTSYGNQQTFTTYDGQSSLTTTTVTDITAKTAISGGNISHDGGASITTRGIVWSTSQNPTIENNHGITANGTGTGSFSCDLSDLMGSTTYYVRAYATNSFGTQYGNQLFFETLIADGTTGTVTYHDYTYQTVYINQREWFAENLRTTKYNNGTSIPTGYSNVEWGGLNSDAYAIYPYSEIEGLNSEEEVLVAYGALYNWYAVSNSQGLCPTGWSIPTVSQWTELLDYVVVQGYPNESNNPKGAGNVLKSCRQVNSPQGDECETSIHPRWNSNITHYGVDVFGFSALPGGYRFWGSSGDYSSIGGGWILWSSTQYDSDWAWTYSMSSNRGNIVRDVYPKAMGSPVRCVRIN